VIFTGGGFAANEKLNLWRIGPDGNVTPMSSIVTDATGTFSTTVRFPVIGLWQVTAHSTVSSNEVDASYTVVDSTGTATAPVASSAVPVTNASGASAPQVALGSPVSIAGSGFTPGETISLWETGPGGAVSPISTLQADANGAFSSTITFSVAGQWQVTAHGATSGKQTINTYVAGVAASTGSAPGASSVISVTNGVGTSAPQVNQGSSVTFSGGGFAIGETVSLWETGPDSAVTPISSQQGDETGSVSTVVAFPTVGYWQVTAQGRSSAHVVISGYNVIGGSSSTAAALSAPVASPTGSPTVTAPPVGVPIKATSGTTVIFKAVGFNASEMVDAWTTGPDGTVTRLDPVQASSVGQVSLSTSFASVGLWQVTLHGRESGHQAIGQFQVTASS
jgi:hypothetical protein